MQVSTEDLHPLWEYDGTAARPMRSASGKPLSVRHLKAQAPRGKDQSTGSPTGPRLEFHIWRPPYDAIPPSYRRTRWVRLARQKYVAPPNMHTAADPRQNVTGHVRRRKFRSSAWVMQCAQ